MLQQTQVARVILKYGAFLKKFPTVCSLADAPLGDVLRAWQGLGYNRRAKLLHDCARQITHIRHGDFPKTFCELKDLPGIGSYTAGAIMAFAYNKPAVFIETNIRTVYLYHFFKNRERVTDKEILALVEKHLPSEGRVREWYEALMDYGAHLKAVFGNPNIRSRHHKKQSRFKGSDRQVRGAIIRALTINVCTKYQLVKESGFAAARVNAQLKRLLAEGLVTHSEKRYRLPS